MVIQFSMFSLDLPLNAQDECMDPAAFSGIMLPLLPFLVQRSHIGWIWSPYLVGTVRFIRKKIQENHSHTTSSNTVLHAMHALSMLG